MEEANLSTEQPQTSNLIKTYYLCDKVSYFFDN